MKTCLAFTLIVLTYSAPGQSFPAEIPLTEIRPFAARPDVRVGASWQSFELHSATASFVFRLHLPPDEKPTALLIFLSGSGRGGYDNLRQMTQPGLMKLFDQPQWQKIAVVMPQSPGDIAWDSQSWMGAHPPYSGQSPSDLMRSLMALADLLAQKFHLTPRHMALMGHSMGAFGTLDAAAHFSTVFGRFASLAGGGDPDVLAQNLQSGQLWLFHGDADNNVPVAHSLRIAQALRAVGKEVHLVVFQGAGHGIVDMVATSPEFAEFLKHLLD